jgi:hypothetical protein
MLNRFFTPLQELVPYYFYFGEYSGKRNPLSVTNPALPYRKNYDEPSETIAKLEGKLLLPCAEKRNEHISEIQSKLINWLLNIRLIRSNQVDKVKQLNFVPLFSTPFTDELTSDNLFTSAKFIAWLFLFDDIVDKNLPDLLKNKINLHEILVNFHQLMTGEIDHVTFEKQLFTNQFPNLFAFANAFTDIANDLKHKKISADTRQYFLNNLHLYFKSISHECDHRGNAPESVESYLSVRRHTGAVKLTFSLIALLKGLHLPPSITTSIEFEQLENAAIDALSLMNDIVSFPKERNQSSDEDAHDNIIPVYENLSRAGNILQDAFDQSTKLHNERITSFYQAIDQIRNSSSLSDENKTLLLAYANKVMKGCLFDNAFWSVNDTNRYRFVINKKGEHTEIPMVFIKKAESQEEELITANNFVKSKL